MLSLRGCFAPHLLVLNFPPTPHPERCVQHLAAHHAFPPRVRCPTPEALPFSASGTFAHIWQVLLPLRPSKALAPPRDVHKPSRGSSRKASFPPPLPPAHPATPSRTHLTGPPAGRAPCSPAHERPRQHPKTYAAVRTC
eukprot:352642-Chlamydomonas_euryale.AAC.5